VDTPSLIPEIKAPVLVIAGREDDVVAGLVEAVQPIADGERVNLMVPITSSATSTRRRLPMSVP
jgi:hypothetical protein